ncbi:MAG: hypothetical protein IJE58_02285 [Oscillospiraceae bacterium]|nr:hypothetical protein [Oscillospiraceae bacterium]
MKRSIITLALVLVIAMLTGCAGTPVVYYSDCTCPSGAHTETQPAPQESTPVETTAPDAPAVTDPVAEGAVKTGVAIVASAAESKNAGDADGEAKYDVSVVAVTVDDNGVIQSCIIDSIGTSVLFDVSGNIVSDLTAPIATKNELGENYGMKAYAGSQYEWNEQAAALAAYAVGKTVEELRSGAVDETGHAVDADLATTATIYLGGYVAAVEKAAANAQHLGAQSGDELKLAIIPAVDSSASADAENAGLAQLDVNAAALTLRDGVITSAQIDSVQAKVNFDASGVITTDLTAPIATKNELGEGYGMVAWGGAIAEWNEQAASFAAYITGKTPAEVASIAVDETTKPTDADLVSSVTIKIGGFQALIAKACG